LSRESLGPIVPDTDFRHVNLLFEDQCLHLRSKSSERVAVLNEATTKILQDILTIKECHFEAYLAEEPWDDIVDSRGKAEKNVYLSVDIVLYGPLEMRDTIGELLSKARTYLQHPCYQEGNTVYDNPHVLKLPATLPSQSTQPSTPPLMRAQSSPEMVENSGIQMEEGSQQSQIRRRVATVFDSLTRSKNLGRLEADIRIKTPLLP
jgi:SWI/SNF-related matrix-associated actin-dependent regulator of chromatin subfamily A3